MSKFVFMTAIVLLLLSALSMLTDHQGIAVKLLIICFWILLTASLIYLYEIKEK